MSGPPPTYEEHEKYPTNMGQPATATSPISPVVPASPRATIQPPGYVIYGPPCPTSPNTRIQSHHQCNSTPVYQYGNTVITSPVLTREQFYRRRRLVGAIIVLILVCPLFLFFLVMTLTVWAR